MFQAVLSSLDRLGFTYKSHMPWPLWHTCGEITGFYRAMGRTVIQLQVVSIVVPKQGCKTGEILWHVHINFLACISPATYF